MKERIIKVRKFYKLNQEDFAKRINLTKNYISLIETGNRIPSDRTISDICREFSVNEEWLRTGKGEMFIVKTKDEEIAEMLADIQKCGEDSFKHRLVSALAKLDDSGWDVLETLIDEITKK